ncbi:nascent polypeptide-associated complex subunit alpha, muscle-specific form-like [Erinaceus europaeus]|uniref:Nascent polypeptide-associated complex subunit alpha, muscle-specific form-like n=1 Tax=Erinaceus europaeus TaxID=9365 RepID=A0ABM3W5C2_ERIEU|nr:nascent polypeptide-associated complex subunit alpha, muscle-specific form-like [Erinaceus europaeus]
MQLGVRQVGVALAPGVGCGGLWRDTIPILTESSQSSEGRPLCKPCSLPCPSSPAQGVPQADPSRPAAPREGSWELSAPPGPSLGPGRSLEDGGCYPGAREKFAAKSLQADSGRKQRVCRSICAHPAWTAPDTSAGPRPRAARLPGPAHKDPRWLGHVSAQRPAFVSGRRVPEGARPTWKQSHSRLARSHPLRGRQAASSHFSPRGSARPRPKPSLAPPPGPACVRPRGRPAWPRLRTLPRPQDKTGPCPIAAELSGPASRYGPAPSLGLCTLAAARTAPTAKRECHQSATLSREWTPSPGSALGSVEQVLSGCPLYPARPTRPAGSLLPEVGIPALPRGVQPPPYRTMLCEKDSPFLELSSLPPFPSNGERSRDRICLPGVAALPRGLGRQSGLLPPSHAPLTSLAPVRFRAALTWARSSRSCRLSSPLLKVF